MPETDKAVQRFHRLTPQTDYEVNRCWEWQGPLNDKGRPTLTIGHKKYNPVRVAWEFYMDEYLTDKQKIVWECDNTLCVNPYHHSVGGSPFENASLRDMGVGEA